MTGHLGCLHTRIAILRGKDRLHAAGKVMRIVISSFKKRGPLLLALAYIATAYAPRKGDKTKTKHRIRLKHISSGELAVQLPVKTVFFKVFKVVITDGSAGVVKQGAAVNQRVVPSLWPGL